MVFDFIPFRDIPRFPGYIDSRDEYNLAEICIDLPTEMNSAFSNWEEVHLALSSLVSDYIRERSHKEKIDIIEKINSTCNDSQITDFFYEYLKTLLMSSTSRSKVYRSILNDFLPQAPLSGHMEEMNIGLHSGLSGTIYDSIQLEIDIPENLNGLRTLDVGGGASNLTVRLLKRGADAYSADPNYVRIPRLIYGTLETINSMKYIQGVSKDIQRDTMKKANRGLQEFKESINSDFFRYIAAYASSLPFPDQWFDLITSIYSLTRYVDRDYETLLLSVIECIRVCKVNGKIVLFPFGEMAGDPDFKYITQRLNNQSRLIELLSSMENVSVKIINVPLFKTKRLEITREN